MLHIFAAMNLYDLKTEDLCFKSLLLLGYIRILLSYFFMTGLFEWLGPEDLNLKRLGTERD